MEQEIKTIDESIALMKELMQANSDLLKTAEKFHNDLLDMDKERVRLNKDLEEEIRQHNILKRSSNNLYQALKESKNTIDSLTYEYLDSIQAKELISTIDYAIGNHKNLILTS